MTDEIKTKRGRPRTKFRPPILSPEQVLALQTPQQIKEAEARERERQRGIERRREARVEKALESVETKEALWELNRTLLSETELTALQERQSDVFDLTFAMRKFVDGTYEQTTAEEDRVPLEAIAEEVEIEIKRGVVTMELVLLGDYWKTPLYTERFQGTDPDSVFARLGLVVSLPSHSVYNFQQFLSAQATETATAQPNSNGFTNKIPTALNRRRSIGESHVI
jgi:hypothetical protein